MTGEEKASVLPSRYEQVLNERFAAAMNALQQSQARQPMPRRRRPWRLVGGSASVALAVMAMNAAPGSARSSVPFASTNSVQVMGLSHGPADFLPPPKTVVATNPGPTPHPSPTRAMAAPASPPQRSAPPAAPFTLAEPGQIAWVEEGPHGTTAFLRSVPEETVVFDEDKDPGLTIMAEGEDDKPRRVVNLGTRFGAKLVYPVRTGGAPVPVSARVEADVKVGEHTAIKAGALLFGSAIATRDSDRVQIAFNALVQDGLTTKFQGVALGTDGEMGVLGRLKKKATGGRRWAARAAGAVGAAFSLDMARKTSGLTGTAARELAYDVDRDFDYFERTWGEARSDKVIEAAAGSAFVVSLNADIDAR